MTRAGPSPGSFTTISRTVHDSATEHPAAPGTVGGVEAGRTADEVIRTGGLEIHAAEGLVVADRRALKLSVREFDLLVALARSAGGIVRREDLFAWVWGHELRAGDRSIDVYVHKLRVKLEQALPDRAFIHTHVGFGYRFAPRRRAGQTTGSPTRSDDRIAHPVR
jgi:DNA-binding response OmpR family regulator